VTRLRRIADHGCIVFITTNLQLETVPFAPAERDTLLEVIAARHDSGAFWLFGYVVMPTHLHLLLAPHNQGLSALMRGIKSAAGSRVAEGRRTRISIWQPKYFDNIIKRVGDFWSKLDYVHQNPVVAGLVAHPEDWRWSSSRAHAKLGKPPIPVDEVSLPADHDYVLWRR
jgi:REP element-mobilizing transposase RayT